MVKRFIDQQKVGYLEFYAMSTDKKPIFTQYHGEGACGQMILIVVPVWEIVKQMKNGFNVQYATFGSTMTAFTTD